MSDNYWMAQAYDLALKAEAAGEVPVGAVIVDKSGKLLGCGYNQVVTKNDPTAHAEVLAIQSAAALMGNYRLDNTTLFVTLEPCPMCAGAMVHARIKRVVFACRDLKGGAAGSVCNVLKGYPFNHEVAIDEGPMQEASSLLLKEFFKTRR